VGDTESLEQVDRFRFMEENERVIMNGGRPASGRPMAARDHQGIALDRLVHLAASFQKTTRVLTERRFPARWITCA
jgi:DNA-directed RNA polymerase subunit beta'